MGTIILLILGIILGFMFFTGNIMILDTIAGGGTADLSKDLISISIAIVADIILLTWVIIEVRNPVMASFPLMRSGLKNRRYAKKESARLRELLSRQEPDAQRLEGLRRQSINKNAIERTLHFCRLIETIAGKEQMQSCMSGVNEKQRILYEIDETENKLLKIAECCKNAGDALKFQYYLALIKSEKFTPSITALRAEWQEQLILRDKERKAMRLWKRALVWFLVISTVIVAMLWVL